MRGTRRQCRLSARLRDERGWALVMSMIVMALLLSVSFSVFAFVDGQQGRAAKERVRESAYNLAEAVLSQQAFIVARSWPSGPAKAYAAPCTSTSPPSVQCVDASWVAAQFNLPDYAGSSWSVQVVDDAAPSRQYYKDGVTNAAGQPGYDANVDHIVWLRAQATVHGQRRTVVAQLQLQPIDQSPFFPRSPVTAGSLHTTNNGNKVIIDTQGPSGSPGPVRVRCARLVPGCLVYQVSKGQISPDTTVDLYNDGGHAISPALLDQFRQRAINDGTYYASGCPADPSGAVVFVENANCSYAHINGCCNSRASPGMLIFASGTLSFTGNDTFYGLIYMANGQNSLFDVLTLGGRTTIQGSILIDTTGGLAAGSSGVNVVYDSSIFTSNLLFTYGSAGVVQSTFREIVG